MMDSMLIQRLRDLPIEEVAEQLGLHVKRHKSLCPFHKTDKHPSLSFHTGKNICRCFVCMNEAIGPITLVMRYRNVGFREACEWLSGGPLNTTTTTGPSLTLPQGDVTGRYKREEAKTFEPARYERFFERPWLSAEARRFLFEERRLDPRVIGWCRISSWRDKQGVNWLQTPYYDIDGKLIGVQNRNLGCPESEQTPLLKPRFRFPYGSKISIYNLPMLRYLKQGDECWIAEGCSDAWSHMSDRHKVIAIASATLLQPHDKELLQEVTARLEISWKMAPDQDEPGLRLAAQLKEILPMLQIVELEAGCKDYSDFYLRRKSKLLTDN